MKKSIKKPFILLALIKMSGIGVTEASGKLGGNVFARNRGGAIIRNRVVPLNPQTDAQQFVRAAFGAMSALWRTLTNAQRQAWDAVVNDFPTVNRLGETRILSGNSLFLKLNQNLAQVGISHLSVPPVPSGVNAPTGINISTFEISGGSLLMDVQAALADLTDNTTRVVLEATPPLSPGLRNANNRFRQIASGTVTAGLVTFDTDADYTNVFGLPAVGTQVQFRVRSINPDSGEASVHFKATTIVE